MPPHAFLFDVEGVLRNSNLSLIAGAFAAHPGVDVTRFPRALGGQVEEVSEIFRLARTGAINAEEFRARVRQELLVGAESLTDEEFDRAYCAGFPEHLDPAPFTLVQELRQRGYKSFILSNNNYIHTSLLRHQAKELLGDGGLESLFVRTLFSFEIGVCKPDPQAFQIALEAIGLPPEEIVFIDDKARNTNVAAALGMQVITLPSFLLLTQKVEEFLTQTSPTEKS